MTIISAFTATARRALRCLGGPVPDGTPSPPVEVRFCRYCRQIGRVGPDVRWSKMLACYVHPQCAEHATAPQNPFGLDADQVRAARAALSEVQRRVDGDWT